MEDRRELSEKLDEKREQGGIEAEATEESICAQKIWQSEKEIVALMKVRKILIEECVEANRALLLRAQFMTTSDMEKPCFLHCACAQYILPRIPSIELDSLSKTRHGPWYCRAIVY